MRERNAARLTGYNLTKEEVMQAVDGAMREGQGDTRANACKRAEDIATMLGWKPTAGDSERIAERVCDVWVEDSATHMSDADYAAGVERANADRSRFYECTRCSKEFESDETIAVPICPDCLYLDWHEEENQ